MDKSWEEGVLLDNSDYIKILDLEMKNLHKNVVSKFRNAIIRRESKSPLNALRELTNPAQLIDKIYILNNDGVKILNEINLQIFKKYNIEKYFIVPQSDEKLCDSCYDIWVKSHREGGLPTDQYEIGKTAPPMHKNCRCQTMPIVKGIEELSEWLMYNNAGSLQQFISLNSKTSKKAEELINAEKANEKNESLLDKFINWFSAYGRAEIEADGYMYKGTEQLLGITKDFLIHVIKTYGETMTGYYEYLTISSKQGSSIYAGALAGLVEANIGLPINAVDHFIGFMGNAFEKGVNSLLGEIYKGINGYYPKGTFQISIDYDMELTKVKEEFYDMFRDSLDGELFDDSKFVATEAYFVYAFVKLSVVIVKKLSSSFGKLFTEDSVFKSAKGSGIKITSTPKLEDHLTNRQLINPKTGKPYPNKMGIVGAHNADEFYKNDIKIVSESKVYDIKGGEVNGVKTIKYQMPKMDKTGTIIPGQYQEGIPQVKTIYDPKIISNESFVNRGIEAANNATSKYQDGILPREWTGVDSQGVTWRGYFENGEITSFYPE